MSAARGADTGRCQSRTRRRAAIAFAGDRRAEKSPPPDFPEKLRYARAVPRLTAALALGEALSKRLFASAGRLTEGAAISRASLPSVPALCFPTLAAFLPL